jgi:hypothetical protein
LAVRVHFSNTCIISICGVHFQPPAGLKGTRKLQQDVTGEAVAMSQRMSDWIAVTNTAIIQRMTDPTPMEHEECDYEDRYEDAEGRWYCDYECEYGEARYEDAEGRWICYVEYEHDEEHDEEHDVMDEATGITGNSFGNGDAVGTSNAFILSSQGQALASSTSGGNSTANTQLPVFSTTATNSTGNLVSVGRGAGAARRTAVFGELTGGGASGSGLGSGVTTGSLVATVLVAPGPPPPPPPPCSCRTAGAGMSCTAGAGVSCTPGIVEVVAPVAPSVSTSDEVLVSVLLPVLQSTPLVNRLAEMLELSLWARVSSLLS